MRILALALALAWTTASALGSEFKDAAYYCIVEMVGGIGYDEKRKRWASTMFTPSGNFVLRLKFEHSKVEKLFSISEPEPVGYFKVTATETGKNKPRECRLWTTDSPLIRISKDGWFSCSQGLTEYRFNLRTNRFLGAYLEGYVGGQDNNNDTPAIQAGTCTKID